MPLANNENLVDFFGSSKNIVGEVFKDLLITSSDVIEVKFLASSFSNCIFFTSNIVDCVFENCKFIDCEFRFSKIENCKFEHSLFESCKWESSRMKATIIYDCLLDANSFAEVAA